MFRPLERQGIAQGIEQGIEQDIEQGIELSRSIILRFLHRQVSELPEAIVEKVNQLSVEALESLGEALLDFDEMDDLKSVVG